MPTFHCWDKTEESASKIEQDNATGAAESYAEERWYATKGDFDEIRVHVGCPDGNVVRIDVHVDGIELDLIAMDVPESSVDTPNEPKTIWPDFIRWLCRQDGWENCQESRGMLRAVEMVTTRNEARAVFAAAVGHGDEQFEAHVREWMDDVRGEPRIPAQESLEAERDAMKSRMA
jgi:hypothetical protein